MARCNSSSAWDFVKVGGIYQYKEDSHVFIVEVLEDTSTDTFYQFKLRPLAGTWADGSVFSVSYNKSSTGAYNGQAQFFDRAEYMPMPMGAAWRFVFDQEKLNGTEFIWPSQEEKPNES